MVELVDLKQINQYMEVLKKGKKTETIIKRECVDCNTVYSLTWADILLKSEYLVGGGRNIIKYFICQNCGHWIYLNDLTDKEEKILTPNGLIKEPKKPDFNFDNTTSTKKVFKKWFATILILVMVFLLLIIYL